MIDRDTAHLWYLETAIFREPSTTERWLASLQPPERIRYFAFRDAAAREEYLATRALARTALSRYTGQPVERLRFRTDRHGRPEMTSPASPELFFSLANTNELAVGLFAFDRDVGADVELAAPIAAGEIAERYFSARELAALATLEEAARLSRFYELWTLREAYLKARGVGLALPLEQLDFEPTRAGSARAAFGPAIGDDPANWQFGLTWLSDRHLAATCIRRRSPEPPPRIVLVDARALVGEATLQLPE